MRYRIRWRAVILLAVASGLIVLVLRGCLMAQAAKRQAQSTPAPTAEPALAALPDADLSVTVFLHREDGTREMPLEAYILGVVAAEMPASFDPEALRAQAVAARTYTLYKGAHGGCRSASASVCTNSACCQAYAPDDALRVRWGADYADNLSKITDAVASTAGQVLLYDGAPIEALYHSASGGRTEDSEAVYAAAVPYLRAVESTNESGSSRLTGTATFSRKDFASRVNSTWAGARLDPATLENDVEILRTSESGRVQEMRLGGKAVTGKQVRRLFGLDSTLFTVTFTRSSVRFDTRGFGHGVGMSQTGANSMGKGGRTYEEILLYYYTGTTLGRIES